MSPPIAKAPSQGRLLAYVLLTLVALFWALNTDIARATAYEVPPIALSFWRSLVSALVFAPFAIGACWRNRALIARHFWFLNLLAALQMTFFNLLVYTGIHHTQAINANLLQGSLPINILFASALFAGRRISLRQWAGVALGLAGLMTIVVRGDPTKLLDLSINPGDPMVYMGVFCSASYAAILNRRPEGLTLVPLMFMLMVFSSVQTLPFYIWEHITQGSLPMTWSAIGTVLYVAIFASVLAQLFFAEGVRRIGAPATGNMIYLTPVFGVVIAIVFLGETFHPFHAIGVGMIAVGIWLALFGERKGA